MKQSDQTESNLPKISAPAHRALAGAGITRLEQLTKMTEADLKKLHGLGAKGINILREAMQERGLSFKDNK